MTEYASLREKIAAEKAERLARYAQFEQFYAAAHAAGLAAGNSIIPTPMVVAGYENDPVMDGPCGFAWVVVRPGNSSFATWLKKNGLGRNAYGGGVHIWVSGFGQSHARKSAYADAFAQSLRDSLTAAGMVGNLRIYGASRLD